jgi:hypothetical protein
MDVKSTILNGHIKEDVYVEQPLGFEDHKYPNHVFKLDMAIYGLKQALRECYECLRDFLIADLFKVGKVDPTLFTKTINMTCLYAKYMWMILFLVLFINCLVKKFEMSMMGELKFFLGFQVKLLKDGTFISQTKYTQDILKKFGINDAKPIKIPMETNGHLDLDIGGKSVDQKVYQSMTSSLPYLCLSRPDIMLYVCMCARFQASPKECHRRAVKRILRYLVHNPNFGLWYPKGSNFDLIRYSDSNYVECKVDMKRTSETCQFLEDLWCLGA